MSVTKINGFRAPYRSQTFQQQVATQIGRSGVLSMLGSITQTSTTITVPPLTFVQNGLIIQKTGETALSIPSLEAPYYLTAFSPNPTNVDNLQFIFASNPLELGGAVIIAAWDGTEWRTMPSLSVDGVYEDLNKANIDFGRVGPVSGLITTKVGSYWSVSSGVIIDHKGLRQEMGDTANFPAVDADPDFSRIDRIIYRRAEDHPDRVGHRDFLLGSSFKEGGPELIKLTTVFTDAEVRSNVKVVTTSDNAAHIFCATGYGGSYQLTYAKVSSDRTTVLVPQVDLFPISSTAFDVKADSDDKLQVVYALDGQIKWRKLTSVGASSVGPYTVSGSATACSNPRLSLAPAIERAYITYQSLLAANNNQIFLTAVEFGGTTVFAPKNLLSSTGNLVNPDVYVSDDLIVHVAWEDLVFNRCYFKRFDDVGDILDLTATNVSSGTVRLGYSTLVDGAKNPRIVFSENKKLFVLFLQNKGSSEYGLSIWSDGVAEQTALISLSENITHFDFDLDPIFNAFGIFVGQSDRLDYARLREGEVTFTLSIASSSGASSVALVKDRLGSLLNVWAEGGVSTTYSSYASDVDVLDIGPAFIDGLVTDVSLGTDQILVASAGLSPNVGDRVVITGSTAGNDGTRAIRSVALVSLETTDDHYIVQLDSVLAGVESPAVDVKAEFLAPDGSAVKFGKSTPEIKASAYSLNDLESDILLARLLLPSESVLNYNAAGVDASRFEFYLVHGDDEVSVDWFNTQEGCLTITGDLKILNLVTGDEYTPTAASYEMTEGDAIYVLMDGSDLSPDLNVCEVIDLPWNLPIQVLGVVKEGSFVPHLLALGGITVLDPGETNFIGQELSASQKIRLGLTSDTTYEAYSSTEFIETEDSYPDAISKLDQQMGAIAANVPKEEEFLGDGVEDTFEVTSFNFSQDNTVYDLIVWQDGRKQPQDPTGGLNKAYRKVSTTEIQFTEAPRAGVRITIRKEGTSYGGAYEPTAGKLWSDPVDANIVPPDLAFNLGGATNRFDNGYIDTLHVNELVYNNNAANTSDTKTKYNSGVRTIDVGEVVSLYTDGSIKPVDPANATSSLLIGIALESIPAYESGLVALFGKNLPGVLTGKGFTPGFEIYVSSTGQLVDSSVAFTTETVIAKLGWSDTPGNNTGATATDLILHYEKVETPAPV